jgi:hypothetical protein
LAVGVRGVQADRAAAAGDCGSPRAVGDMEVALRAGEQRSYERERLYGGLRRAGVGAAAVPDQLLRAVVVDLDDV